MSKQKLLEHIEKLSGKKILIVGDVGLDEYILGEVKRISPEAPVPVLEVEKEDVRLGLSANVAQNVSSLGGIPLLISVVGKDSGADLLNQLFKRTNVSTDYLVTDGERPTTRKARIMAKHHHLVRVDYETRKFLSTETEKKVLQKVEQAAPLCDAIIVEDYAKGVINDSLLKSVVSIGKKFKKKILVDPHRTNRGEFYSGIDLIKPNFDEAVALSGLNYDDLRDHPNKIIEIGQALQKKTGASDVVITRGKDGMTIISGSKVENVPTFARQVFDVTGAGDTVIATMALGIVSGLTLSEACMLANYAAGVVVGQVGCVPCTVAELREYIQSAPH
jgi:D-glycero-beta-D-manno-heptose-7-phosphate kinase